MTRSDFPGGLPPQSALMTGRAALTPAYLMIPRTCLSDITASHLPGWRGTRLWILARPMTGLAETFSHYLLDIAPGGGCDRAEPEPGAQGVVYVMDGDATLEVEGTRHDMTAGSYAYLPAGSVWDLSSRAGCRLHWYRKRWQPAVGIAAPAPFVTDVSTAETAAMPDTDGRWTTTRFVDPSDLAHDMHVNLVTFQPGGSIPFEETHVMEHSIHVLSGKAAYKLNTDWVEMEAGDTAILRAFCPQACYAAGPEPFSYLLYKDVNRHVPLSSFGHAEA